MQERHHNEQYFFDPETTKGLADLVECFDNPVCLCAPTVGVELRRRGRDVAVLDIDERFDLLPRFRSWDIKRPVYLGEAFDLVLCDPPFFGVSLTEIFKAVRVLSHFDYGTPVIISYLARRADAFLRVFEPFGLRQTALHAEYPSLDDSVRNEIVFFSNVPL